MHASSLTLLLLIKIRLGSLIGILVSVTDGSPYLGVYAQDNKAMALLSINDSNGVPYLGLWDHNNQERAELDIDTDNWTYLYLKDEKSVARNVTGVGPEGSALLTIYGRHQQPAAFGFHQDSRGCPVFYLNDEENKERFRVSLEKNSKAHVTEIDENGRTAWRSP